MADLRPAGEPRASERLLAGYAMGNRERRSWLHVVLYSAVVAITIYVVLDLDHPRSGLIRLDAADNALVELRNSIRDASP